MLCEMKETFLIFTNFVAKFIRSASGYHLILKYNKDTNEETWKTSDEEIIQWVGLEDDNVYSLENPAIINKPGGRSPGSEGDLTKPDPCTS